MEEKKKEVLRIYVSDLLVHIKTEEVETINLDYCIDKLERCLAILNDGELLGEEEYC